MSDIRQYLKNRQSGEDDEYEQKLKKHRRKVRIVAASVIIVIFIIGMAVKIYLDNRFYDIYEIQSETEMNNTGNNRYYMYGDGMLIYSDDGLVYYNDGVTVWNQAFEMKKPIVDICEATMAISDYNTTTVYIYNTEGELGTIQTVYPIIDIAVSEQGVIAAITDDSETNRIEIFDKTGASIAVGQTYVTGEGCPVDISLSNDGTKLVVAYIYVDGGKSKSKVVFYNYSEVGKNEVSRIVGGFNQYEDTIVTRVEFMDNDTVAAYGENIFSIYSIKQKPELIKDVTVDKKIKSIFNNEKYIGLMLDNDDYDNPYTVRLYDTDGDVYMEYDTDLLYKGISIKDNCLVIYNDTTMKIITASGREKYSGDVAEGIINIIPTSKNNLYYIVNDKHNIMKIKMK